jgi:Peptidase family M1 domain
VARFPAVLVLLTLRCAFATSASGLAQQIQQMSLDPEECYRVLEFNFSKEDLKIYLTSGYLTFTKPVHGERLGAAFVADADGGDAEVLLLPPTRSERQSLANFTKSPNLEEHFKAAVFLFTDGTGDELWRQLQSNPGQKKKPEAGELIASQYTDTLRNLADSFEPRLVFDLLSGDPKAGLFYAGISGDKLGTFDLLYDPANQDQISAGRLAYRNNRTYFDTWTSFPARSARNHAPAPAIKFSLNNFQIEATIENDLTMKAVTRAELTVHQDAGPVIPISISRNMRITSASIDGRPVEVFDRESLRLGLIAPADDRRVLLVLPSALAPNTPHRLEIHHEGAVIQKAGDGVYFVASRGTWYPHVDLALANYDLLFRYPKTLTLVASGDSVEDRTEGDWRITRRKPDSPIRFAGFNLGDFSSRSLEQDGYHVEVYANQSVERALAPVPEALPLPSLPRPRRRLAAPAPTEPEILVPPAPDPGGRVRQIIKSVADALDFMTAKFGPAPLHNLAITPIPGRFGQGFPGLIYLSTLAYLNPDQRPSGTRSASEETFFSDLLESHEIAHQWWGNLVIPASYHDAWLIESLANYSALLLLEKKKGTKALDDVLAQYKSHLLTKDESGRTLESAGPVTWGYRLESSLAPGAWQSVTYEKGTWIIHMLRRRMGDERFLSFLHEICVRYRFSSISTEQFRELAQQFMPPQSPDRSLSSFFENWVDGTGIPAVKLSYALRALTLTGTIEQRAVDDDFSAFVPLEVQTGNRKAVYWLSTGSDPVPFSIRLKAPPSKVTLLTADCLIVGSR